MIWREGKGALPGSWIGPMKVVVHENQSTIWTTMSSKLYRSSPEAIRPVTAVESHRIQLTPDEPSISQIAQQLRNVQGQGTTQAIDLQLPGNNQGIEFSPQSPEVPSVPAEVSSQPDNEPEAPPSEIPTSPDDTTSLDLTETPNEIPNPEVDDGVQVPVPGSEEELVCDSLQCIDTEPCAFDAKCGDVAWRCEVFVSEGDINQWKSETNPEEMSFVASAAKRQRAEVKLCSLTPKEKEEFAKAKQAEIQNWISTGTISRILRHKTT